MLSRQEKCIRQKKIAITVVMEAVQAVLIIIYADMTRKSEKTGEKRLNIINSIANS